MALIPAHAGSRVSPREVTVTCPQYTCKLSHTSGSVLVEWLFGLFSELLFELLPTLLPLELEFELLVEPHCRGTTT